jgi:hypothetical protein
MNRKLERKIERFCEMDRLLEVSEPERSRQLRRIALGKRQQPPRGHTEVIERMLRPKIAGQALDDEVAHLLHEADLYSATPNELVAGRPPGLRESWYFLTYARYSDGRRMLRQHANGGCWRPCSRFEVVAGKGNGPVGHRRYYFYTLDNVKTDWAMIEYSIPQDQQGDGEQLVICKMRNLRYRRFARLNSASSCK